MTAACTTLGDLHLHRATPWLWLNCERCLHHAPLACAVAAIRWGPNTSSDKLRQSNQVERWFAELARKRLRRGVHTSVRQLEADIRAFIDRHNQNPRPFKWTKSLDQILASVKRFCHKTQQTLCGEL